MTNIVRREMPRFFVATILLSNGQTRAHKLDISQAHTVEKYCAVGNPWVKPAAAVVLGNSDDGFFSLDNPFFFYNVNHVMGIGFHYEGADHTGSSTKPPAPWGFWPGTAAPPREANRGSNFVTVQSQGVIPCLNRHSRGSGNPEMARINDRAYCKAFWIPAQSLPRTRYGGRNDGSWVGLTPQD